MLPAPDSVFCPHHARRYFPSQPRDEALAAELFAGIPAAPPDDSAPSVASPDDSALLVALRPVALRPVDVNRFLGNLLKQFAHKRISRVDAVALAYISQVLLNSLAALDREQSRATNESRSAPFVIINDSVPIPPERRRNLTATTLAANPPEPPTNDSAPGDSTEVHE